MELKKNAELSESLEDYLEAIYCIIEERKVARPKDIVKRLGVTNASVTGALRLLAQHELIFYSPHEFVSFTEKGARVAAEVYCRHRKLHVFLTVVLNISPEQANSTACKMEHIIPDPIIDRLVRLSEFIANSPDVQNAWNEFLTKNNN